MSGFKNEISVNDYFCKSVVEEISFLFLTLKFEKIEEERLFEE